MTPFLKLLSSSTVWLGAIVAGIQTYASTAGVALSPWLSAALVLAYGIKEAASKLAGEPKVGP